MKPRKLRSADLRPQIRKKISRRRMIKNNRLQKMPKAPPTMTSTVPLSTGLLKAHFNSVERALLAMGEVSGNAGHNNHIGTPREWLLRNFLSQHLPSTFEVGTGEIISASSKPEDARNQFDLVIHRREHPRLDYGGGISAFLIEAVSATIEVKSKLSYEEFKNASIAARNIKTLTKSISTGVAFGKPLPSPVSYIVAYDGPASFNTVYEWLPRLKKEEGFIFPALPPNVKDRVHVACPGIDAVFVLGKGFMYFDNAAVGWLPDEERKQNPAISWLWANQSENNLLFYFLLLNAMISGFKHEQINPVEYMKGAGLPGLAWGV